MRLSPIGASILIIGLGGAGIYLAALAWFMFSAIYYGSATLIPDYVLLHGEPLLVVFFAAVAFYVSFDFYRGLLTSHKQALRKSPSDV